MTSRRSDMGGPGIISDRKNSGTCQIDQTGKLGAADEIDRRRAGCADFGGEGLFAHGADDDGKGARGFGQKLCERAIVVRGPTLSRVARR
jgi:hypothetical protein